MSACGFVPLSHETYKLGDLAAMKFLDKVAWTATGAGNISKRGFLENAMRRLSKTLCRGPCTRRRTPMGAPSQTCVCARPSAADGQDPAAEWWT